jgi:outer membrane protein OmpA-like peptidoglycan-associated protein
MRGLTSFSAAAALVTALTATISVGAEPVAHNTPDQIVCKISGSCEACAPCTPGDPSKQIKVGDERAFSLARPDAIKLASPAVGTTATAKPARLALRAPVKRHALAAATPATSSGGLDMQVSFDNGSAILTEQAKAEARAFAEAMRSPALAGMRFSIDGHTDAVGNRDYNLDLSKRRAQSVADYLATLGIDAARLDTHGYGFDKPRPGTAPRSPVNRRVEFAKLS